MAPSRAVVAVVGCLAAPTAVSAFCAVPQSLPRIKSAPWSRRACLLLQADSRGDGDAGAGSLLEAAPASEASAVAAASSKQRRPAPARKAITLTEYEALTEPILAADIEGPRSSVTSQEEAKRCQTDKDLHWYVIQVYTTFEKYAANVIEARCGSWGLADCVDRVVVPMRAVPQTFGKRVRTKNLPLYPGYVYTHVKMSELLRDRVNEIPKVVGYVGRAKDANGVRIPERVPPKRIEKILELAAQVEADDETARVRSEFGIGDMVEITKGTYQKETGALRIVRDGEFVVRLYAYGKRMDVSVPFDAVRKMTEEEIMAETQAQEEATTGAYADTYSAEKRESDARRPRRDRDGPRMQQQQQPRASERLSGERLYEADIRERERGEWSAEERRARREQTKRERARRLAPLSADRGASQGERASGGFNSVGAAVGQGSAAGDEPLRRTGRLGRPLASDRSNAAAGPQSSSYRKSPVMPGSDQAVEALPDDFFDDLLGNARGLRDERAFAATERSADDEDLADLQPRAANGAAGGEDAFLDDLMRELQATPAQAPGGEGQALQGAGAKAGGQPRAGTRGGRGLDDTFGRDEGFDLDLDLDLHFEQELNALLGGGGGGGGGASLPRPSGANTGNDEFSAGTPARAASADGFDLDAQGGAASLYDDLPGLDGDTELDSLLAELEAAEAVERSPAGRQRGVSSSRRDPTVQEASAEGLAARQGTPSNAFAGAEKEGVDGEAGGLDELRSLISDLDLLPPAPRRQERPPRREASDFKPPAARDAFEERTSASTVEERREETIGAPIAAAIAAERPTGTAEAAAATAPAAVVPTGGYEGLKVPELKEALRARGLAVSGKKQELVERLLAADKP